MSFNPNELILERIRAVEEYDRATGVLTARYTQIEEPSLKTAAEGTQVTDAMGAEIVTFYHAQTGTFSFSNSLFSLDLAASQFGSKKEIAGDGQSILRPAAETIPIQADGTAVLSHVPAGANGSQIRTIRLLNDDNTFGRTISLSKAEGDGGFTLDAAKKTVTLPKGTSGRIFVRYDALVPNSVKITKTTDGIPEVKSLLIHAIFHDPCDTNTVYAGIISVPRAQINPESVELSMTADGKHAAEYKLQKAYCDDNSKLFEIIVSQD